LAFVSVNAEALLAALDDEQRKVATAVRGPVLVIAGAGTGKTRAITQRIAYGVEIGAFDPRKVLALTFTAKAAGEMRQRLRVLGIPGVQARTFHAAALRQLIYFWPEVLGGRFPKVLTTKSSLLSESAGQVGSSVKINPQSLREISSEVEWSKSLSLAPDQYVAEAERSGRETLAPLGEIARIYEAYESIKRDERVIDFEDVLLLTIGMLEEESSVASRVRDQYRFFTVDEYQDVSPLQQRLLDLWLGSRKDICVVGDPAQTIYSFTGATPAFLLNFTKRYPEAEVVRLNRGYRSTQEIINYANQLIRDEASELIAGQTRHGDLVRLSGHPRVEEEIRAIVREVENEIATPRDPRRIAILARTNSQLEALARSLRIAGIEFQIRENERFFDSREVMDSIRLIRSASVLSDPNGDWRSELDSILAPLGGDPKIRAIRDLAMEDPTMPSMRDFLRELEDRKDQNNPPQLPGVTLATFHAAKGLEWDSVYLFGVSEGIVPWPSSSIEEEKRLLYVGVTRAKERLSISYSGVSSPLLNK
jgi:DNA helicase-2/ATP-dependent DNA helicase PcrA